MKLLRDLVYVPAAVRGGAVAIGNFDGVHKGHARIVERLLAEARECAGPVVVFTFDPHPVRLLRPEQAPPPLTWTDRKAELLAELGIHTTIAYPTDEALLQLSPEQFFQYIVCDKLQARAMVEGTNFFFGHRRAGNIEVLRQLCAGQGIPLEVVEPVTVDGAPVSSSRVRQCIAAGKIDEANRMLTRPYRIRGMVRHGAARGAKIGFPTANVDAIDTLLPGVGVYAGRCEAEGRAWPAAISVGPNPTFGEQTLKVEVHLIGFHDSLYGQPLEVDFLARLRDIVQFASVEALKTQLAQDVTAAEKSFQQIENEQPRA
ncbi:MAG TPA: bifunctional riboflavin kinase/FAD synthetase [Pirellulales bacterium]|nr:bifunctional riboflavin kinase/FAD synthetase [Pirellulales bacterium]